MILMIMTQFEPFVHRLVRNRRTMSATGALVRNATGALVRNRLVRNRRTLRTVSTESVSMVFEFARIRSYVRIRPSTSTHRVQHAPAFAGVRR